MAKILIIDDEEESSRTLLRLLLEEAGFSILEADNGGKGLQLFRENEIDLVITDIIMPDKEGLETIMDLHKTAPSVKIIAISGGSSVTEPSHYLTMAKQLGAHMTFTKPIDKEQFLGSVKELIGELD